MFNIVSGEGGWNGEVDFRKGGVAEKCHFERGTFSQERRIWAGDNQRVIAAAGLHL